MSATNSSTSPLAQANSASAQRMTDPETSTQENSQKTLFAAIAQLSTAWVISMILHVFLIVGGALFTIAHLSKDEPVTLAMNRDASPEEFETMTLDMPLDFEEMDELETEFEEVALEEMEETLVVPELEADFSESEMLSESDFGELTELDMGAGLEEAESSEKGPKSKFFKGDNKAKTLVYIVDNSNSMTGRNMNAPGFGRMETALVELSKSINNLDKTQKFYVLFYSDTAYGLFHPYTVPDYIAATPQNKQKVNAWLGTVECCLYTKGNEAFEAARKLKPDLIYLLGDGSFGDRAHKNLVKNPIKGTRIEVLGMNLTEGASEGFRQIAKAHGGDYRDVGITPEGVTVLRNFGPRKANKVRGPVWGTALPDTPPSRDMKKKKKKKKK